LPDFSSYKRTKLGKICQMATKQTKGPQNRPKGRKIDQMAKNRPNVHKIDQMSTKYVDQMSTKHVDQMVAQYYKWL
jgi:hypothetical protein